MAACLKEEPGQHEPLPSGCAEHPIHLENGNEVGVRVVHGEEMVDVPFDTFGKNSLQLNVELTLHFGIIVLQGCLSPSQCLLPGHGDCDVTAHAALRVECQIFSLQGDIVARLLLRSKNIRDTLCFLSYASGK